MSRFLRSRWGAPAAAAVVAVLVMILVQRVFLVLPVVSALPAGVAAGAVTAWARSQADSRERLVIAGVSAVVTVVLLALWMLPSTPAGYRLRIIMGWVIVAVILASVHLLVAWLAAVLGSPGRSGHSARLR